MFRIAFYIVCFIFSLCLLGQQLHTFSPEKSIQLTTISQWTSDDGLSSNNNTSVFQSNDGLIWITSFNGFMIYDGQRFDIYDLTNLDILETDGFYKVVQAPDGIIYLASQGSGLIQYQNGVFSLVKVTGQPIPKLVQSILPSTNGTIYLGGINTGLFRIIDGVSEKLFTGQLDKTSIIRIVQDYDNRIWIGTEGDGLFRIENNELTQFLPENGLVSKTIRSLTIDIDGNLLVGTSKGLQIIRNGATISSTIYLAGSQINCIYMDEWYSIWVGTENGLARLHPKTGTEEWLYSVKGVDFVRLTSIIKDHEGSLWVTSNRTGLIRIKESNISNLITPDISSNRVYALHESWNRKIYIGTDINVIDILDENEISHITIKTNLGGNGIRQIFHEEDETIWLATYSGIIQYRNGKEVIYDTKFGMPADDFRTVLKDSKGYYWFGSRSGGLVKFRDGKIIRIFDREKGLKSNFILSVVEGPDGRIYVGTHSGGLSIIDENDQVKTYHYKGDDSGIPFFNIRFDQTNRLWIVTNIGLTFFENQQVNEVKLTTDKRSKTFFDMLFDQSGNCWATTNIGICKIEKEDLENFISGKISEVPFILVDDKDGMSNKEVTGATRSLVSSNGKLFVQTLGGVSIIDPANESKNTIIPKVKIRKVITDDVIFDTNKGFTKFNAGVLRFTFEFTVLSYRSHQRNKFRYKLEGFDKDWSMETSASAVEYTNLKPGLYTFKVIGSNDSNIWNEFGDEYSFFVKPYFHQTVWFYLIIFVLVAAILLLIYRWRVSFIARQNEQLRKVNAELDRFVYSASHDLRSPLSSILGLVKVAKVDDETDKQVYFEHIEKSVIKLDNFIRDIIDYSRNARLDIIAEPVDFEKLLNDILDDISHVQHFDKIEIQREIDPSAALMSDPKRIRIILSNLVGNAIKHHEPDEREKPFVKISVTKERYGVKIVIQDNGAGIEDQYISQIFKMFFRATNRSEGSGLGLYIVQETVSKLKGEIELDSIFGQGTTFTVKLKNM